MIDIIKLCAFELRLLASMAGRHPPLPWDAAVGAALGFLKRDGLVQQVNGVYGPTSLGIQFLDAHEVAVEYYAANLEAE